MSSRHPISLKARYVESQFDSIKSNLLQEFAQREFYTEVESKGITPSDYQLYAVRKNERAGHEVFGPKSFSIGDYSEAALYGAATSLLPQFWTAIRGLEIKARHIKELDQTEVEFSYQVTLFWAEVSKLKEFIGLSPHVSELVSELLTTRFQFLGKDTPVEALASISQALSMLVETKRLDSSVVERLVDILETGGIDSLALDALRH